jgi:hypothetical protein
MPGNRRFSFIQSRQKIKRAGRNRNEETEGGERKANRKKWRCRDKAKVEQADAESWWNRQGVDEQPKGLDRVEVRRATRRNHRCRRTEDAQRESGKTLQDQEMRRIGIDRLAEKKKKNC